MIQKFIKDVKTYFQRKRDLKKSYEYYKVLQAGARLYQFIYADIDRHKTTLNRETRRRFEQQLEKQGKLNEEMIGHYARKIDAILAHIREEQKKS